MIVLLSFAQPDYFDLQQGDSRVAHLCLLKSDRDNMCET
jgi:hypothetical protein